eukprot:351697-Chlamydomonas_euryale.AAC.14
MGAGCSVSACAPGSPVSACMHAREACECMRAWVPCKCMHAREPYECMRTWVSNKCVGGPRAHARMGAATASGMCRKGEGTQPYGPGGGEPMFSMEDMCCITKTPRTHICPGGLFVKKGYAADQCLAGGGEEGSGALADMVHVSCEVHDRDRGCGSEAPERRGDRSANRPASEKGLRRIVPLARECCDRCCKDRHGCNTLTEGGACGMGEAGGRCAEGTRQQDGRWKGPATAGRFGERTSRAAGPAEGDEAGGRLAAWPDGQVASECTCCLVTDQLLRGTMATGQLLGQTGILRWCICMHQLHMHACRELEQLGGRGRSRGRPPAGPGIASMGTVARMLTCCGRL